MFSLFIALNCDIWGLNRDESNNGALSGIIESPLCSYYFQ